MTNDKFGIKMLYPTLTGGRVWYSKWNNNNPRSWENTKDPDDSEFFTGNGTGTYNCAGDGILKIGGDYPRMHIMRSDKTGYWHDVEVTVYGQRKSSLGEDWGGIMAYTRTNHYIDTNTCDTRGYGGRFKYSGEIDFEKEIRHSGPYCHAIAQSGTYWTGGMPQNIWIGYKFVTYDLTDGNVKLELYIDETDGKDGGSWVKIREWTDKGDYNPNNCTGCKSGIDPKLRLINSENRQGSESGYPNLAVYFRTDAIGVDDLWFKRASIRTINPICIIPIYDFEIM